MRNLRAKAPSPRTLQEQVEGAGTLSNVDPNLAKIIVQTGLKDGDSRDDKIHVVKVSVPAVQLKPSQTSMVLKNSVGIALKMLKSGEVGGDVGAIFSSDNYILDGHHRWSGIILASGSKGVAGGYKAEVPGNQLIKVLNILTKGAFNVRNGNPGSGSIKAYTPANVKAVLNEFLKSGSKDFNADVVGGILESSFGSVDSGLLAMAENVTQMNTSVPGWAPDRSDMPVIDKRNMEEAKDLLTQGVVNWKTPYEVKEAMIRLASTLPKGTAERRDLLKILRQG